MEFFEYMSLKVIFENGLLGMWIVEFVLFGFNSYFWSSFLLNWKVLRLGMDFWLFNMCIRVVMLCRDVCRRVNIIIIGFVMDVWDKGVSVKVMEF